LILGLETVVPVWVTNDFPLGILYPDRYALAAGFEEGQGI